MYLPSKAVCVARMIAYTIAGTHEPPGKQLTHRKMSLRFALHTQMTNMYSNEYASSNR